MRLCRINARAKVKFLVLGDIVCMQKQGKVQRLHKTHTIRLQGPWTNTVGTKECHHVCRTIENDRKSDPVFLDQHFMYRVAPRHAVLSLTVHCTGWWALSLTVHCTVWWALSLTVCTVQGDEHFPWLQGLFENSQWIMLISELSTKVIFLADTVMST